MSRFFFTFALLLAFSAISLAQDTNSSTSTNARPRTTTNRSEKTRSSDSKADSTPAKPTPTKATATSSPGSDTVLAAFNKIIEGIKKANVDLTTSGYLNSPALVLFNYNGSVTKGWDQMRKNRESSYPDIKDVKLELRDVHVQMLGRDGAIVTCLWSQSQTYKSTPDSASGRMTLAFKRVGTSWKAVHLHTSPDRPDASRVPASEQTPSPATKP
jgi:ketosteroid isomerase-like protein